MKRCLLICPIGIGNYLLAYPTFFLLKQHFPQTEFFLVSLRKSILDFAGEESLFAGVLDLDFRQNRSLASKMAWVRKIRKLGCDTAVSFFPSNRFEYNALMFACGAKNRFGFAYKRKRFVSAGFLVNHPVSVADGIHDVLQNLRVLGAMGLAVEKPIVFPRLYHSNDMIRPRQWLEEKDVREAGYIGIHAGSSAEHGMIHKRWSASHFAELGRKLAGHLRLKILVMGGPEENVAKREIAGQLGRDAFSVEGFSLRETACLLESCRLFVTNDSGLMHMAALLGVRVAAIFGPTDDRRTAPWGEGHLILRKKMDCCPCWRTENVGKRDRCRYGDFRCLQELGVDEVFRKIMDWYGKT